MRFVEWTSSKADLIERAYDMARHIGLFHSSSDEAFIRSLMGLVEIVSAARERRKDQPGKWLTDLVESWGGRVVFTGLKGIEGPFSNAVSPNGPSHYTSKEVEEEAARGIQIAFANDSDQRRQWTIIGIDHFSFWGCLLRCIKMQMDAQLAYRQFSWAHQIDWQTSACSDDFAAAAEAILADLVSNPIWIDEKYVEANAS